MARGLLGATLGGLSYVFYKQGSLELDEAELCVDGSGFKSAMAKYGACVLQQVVPLQKARAMCHRCYRTLPSRVDPS